MSARHQCEASKWRHAHFATVVRGISAAVVADSDAPEVVAATVPACLVFIFAAVAAVVDPRL